MVKQVKMICSKKKFKVHVKDSKDGEILTASGMLSQTSQKGRQRTHNCQSGDSDRNVQEMLQASVTRVH